MSKNRAADGPGLASTLLFALLLALALSVGAWTDDAMVRARSDELVAKDCAADGGAFFPGPEHRTPNKNSLY